MSRHIRSQGIRHSFFRIWQEEGIASFTRGLKPRLLVLVPAASITFASYEQFKRLLDIYL